MNPLIPMLRQGSNGPHIDHVQSDYERLEDWRMRMLKYAGIEPTRKLYRVVYCGDSRCNKPFWVPMDLDIDIEHYYCWAHASANIRIDYNDL